MTIQPTVFECFDLPSGGPSQGAGTRMQTKKALVTASDEWNLWFPVHLFTFSEGAALLPPPLR